MKIKLDENLPFRLATPLKKLGHDVGTVYDERAIGCEKNSKVVPRSFPQRDFFPSL
jgi:hypothetical protein